MVTELIPAKLAFRGLSDEDEEDPTVVNAPGDLDDDEENEDDDATAAAPDADDDDTASPEQ